MLRKPVAPSGVLREHVQLEVALLRGRVVAEVAAVGPLPGVGAGVPNAVGSPVEPPAAVPAVVARLFRRCFRRAFVNSGSHVSVLKKASRREDCLRRRITLGSVI